MICKDDIHAVIGLVIPRITYILTYRHDCVPVDPPFFITIILFDIECNDFFVALAISTDKQLLLILSYFLFRSR